MLFRSRMPSRVTQISLQFKQPPILLFDRLPDCGIMPSVLTLRIQPNEGISLEFGAKQPGPTLCVKPVTMDFCYSTAFGAKPADAYERLLLDCMLGDATLFARSDGVEQMWSLVMPVLKAWSNTPALQFPNYEAGTWGPKEADALLARDGRQWRRIEL